MLLRHPRLRLDLRLEDRPVDLMAEGVDVAVRAGLPPPDTTTVLARPLCTFERVLCAAPTLLDQHGAPDAIAGLSRLPCLALGASGARWLLHVDGALLSRRPRRYLPRGSWTTAGS